MIRLATSVNPKRRMRHQSLIARREVSRVLATGSSAEALELARNMVIRYPDAADTWYSYGRVLTASSQAGAAQEAYSMALRLDAAHLMALEFYIEGSRGLGQEKKPVTEAIERMALQLPAAPLTDRGALDFLIPRSDLAALNLLASSRDRVTVAAVKINELIAGSDDGNIDDVMSRLDGHGSATELKQAQAIVHLGRGFNSEAVRILQTLDFAEVPLDSLRRAIRRQLTGANPESARPLLKQFLNVSPDDAWAKRWYENFDDKTPTNWQLVRNGFPLGRKLQRDYHPVPDRVLYTLHNSLPFHSAGYATRTHGLLSQLNKLEWEVEGVTRLGYPFDMPGKEDLSAISASDIVDNVTYSRLSTVPGIELKKPLFDYVQRYSRALTVYTRERKPVILHAASNHWNGLATVQTAHKLGTPSIYEVRGLWEVTRGSRNPDWVNSGMYNLIARMEADAAKGATRVLTITDALRREMISRGVPEEKIVVVPNGVDTDRFRPVKRNTELESELGLSGKTVIGYVGSVLDYEGLELLLDAARQLKNDRNDFHVLIVGDGAELESFQQRVLRERLGDVVTFTGRVPHDLVGDYYSLVDIAPFPRLPLPVCEMVSPLKPFEALAMGKAVISSDVAALAEIIDDGVTGLLHRKGDTRDLTLKLKLLLDDEALRARIGEAGMNWVRRERDWKRLARRVADVYSEIREQSAE